LFLDTTLFNQGIRPAINAELSVSRVGSAAQTKAIKKVTRALRLELAQYKELLDFAQFGTELDHISRQRLLRGARTVELLKQQQYMTFSFVDQALMLFLLKENILDALEVNQVNLFARQFVRYVQSVYSDIYGAIEDTKDLSDDIAQRLLQVAQEFSLIFVVKQEL
jgi:F-type H+-transporting ATPase subunit alpha